MVPVENFDFFFHWSISDIFSQICRELSVHFFHWSTTGIRFFGNIILKALVYLVRPTVLHMRVISSVSSIWGLLQHCWFLGLLFSIFRKNFQTDPFYHRWMPHSLFIQSGGTLPSNVIRTDVFLAFD